ncbi:MAG: hypothetical protein WD509_01820 [Candidatus Paceibacterota bacterium]
MEKTKKEMDQATANVPITLEVYENLCDQCKSKIGPSACFQLEMMSAMKRYYFRTIDRDIKQGLKAKKERGKKVKKA